MGELVKAPIRFHRRRVISAEEMYSMPEPPEEMIWELCRYTNRQGERCEGCTDGGEETSHGPATRGCYVWAKEACRVVMAMQKRLASGGTDQQVNIGE